CKGGSPARDGVERHLAVTGAMAATSDRYTSGIDVSHFQGTVAWPAVAAAAIVFAFVKATDGAAHVDEQFEDNWRGIADAGLIRGAYHFFRPRHDVASQVSVFVDAVGSLGAADLSPVLDLEEAK